MLSTFKFERIPAIPKSTTFGKIFDFYEKLKVFKKFLEMVIF